MSPPICKLNKHKKSFDIIPKVRRNPTPTKLPRTHICGFFVKIEYASGHNIEILRGRYGINSQHLGSPEFIISELKIPLELCCWMNVDECRPLVISRPFIDATPLSYGGTNNYWDGRFCTFL